MGDLLEAEANANLSPSSGVYRGGAVSPEAGRVHREPGEGVPPWQEAGGGRPLAGLLRGPDHLLPRSQRSGEDHHHGSDGRSPKAGGQGGSGVMFTHGFYFWNVFCFTVLF